MKTLAKLIGFFTLLSLLAACGGGGNGASFTSGGAPGGTGGSGGSGGTTNSVKLGYTNSSNTFTNGQLNIAVNSLSAGGQTNVTANLVDSSGNPYTTSTAVTFVSTCTGQSKATLTSPVTSSTGTAVAVYTDQGCGTIDTITATATVNGTLLTATGTVTVAPQTVGSIQFVSATPATIALKGMSSSGLTETSTVVFKVLDSVGSPIVGKVVTFALSTNVGGISLSTATATTVAGGFAQTNVQSGNVHTTVGVTATITVGSGSMTISTQSDTLTVTTGIADQNSFSLSVVTLNPEAGGYDGITDQVTARLADRFNNPVPDGTAVAFYTSGGSIGGSCTTTKGACSVDWTGQNPRPANGVAAILAVAIGEESFVDNNSNGIFDAGDTFTDMPEAFLNANLSNSGPPNFIPTYSAGDFFVDFNSNGTYDGGDGKFNGVLCSHPTLCGTTQSINVRGQGVIVMADSTAAIAISPSPINAKLIDVNVTITVVGKYNGLVMPAGTTIVVTTTNGTLSGASSFTVPNSTAFGAGTTTFNLIVKTDGTSSSNGVLTVTVTTPKGFVSSNTATVND
ncbi:MAG: hypothetical protein ACYDC8_05120 [Gammaproteobacteria bacterium]